MSLNLSKDRAPRRVSGRLALTGLALALVAACTPQAKKAAAPPQARLTSAHLSVDQLQKLAAGADPASLGLTPAQPINQLPANADEVQKAEAANAARPFAGLPIEPMRPFVLKTDAGDQARALNCLTQAVYYEAAREPMAGQQAVAQVVLNRVRHPAYPKTVCGVVYQGASLATGCQFTFTCNGALRYRPEADLWARAEAVAKKALAGYVDKTVGSATHYHAAYVAPYWAPTLVKMTQVGQHIFYRWTGAWGEPAAFTGRYAGRETLLTPAVLTSEAPITAPPPREVTLAVGGEVKTYKVADVSAAKPGDAAEPVAGIHASRRAPTKDEIAAINAKLAARFDPQPVAVAQAGAPVTAGTN